MEKNSLSSLSRRVNATCHHHPHLVRVSCRVMQPINKVTSCKFDLPASVIISQDFTLQLPPLAAPIWMVTVTAPCKISISFIMSMHLWGQSSTASIRSNFCLYNSSPHSRSDFLRYYWLLWLPHFFTLEIMSSSNPIHHTMIEVLQKLQRSDILAEEEEFMVITEADLEASVEKMKNSCFEKILVDKELNILSVRRCLRRAWRGQDFRVCKIGTGVYQCFFKKNESLDFILSNGPWSVDEHLLLLTPWKESVSADDEAFSKTYLGSNLQPIWRVVLFSHW